MPKVFCAGVDLKVSWRWCKTRNVEVERPVLREIDLMKGSEEERGLEVAGDKKSWTSSFQLWSTDLNPAPESTKLIVNKVQETNNAKMPLVFDIIESKEGSELKTLKTLEDEMPVTELSLVPPVASSPVVKLGANELRSSIVGGVAASGPRSVQLDWRNAMVMPHHQQHQSRRKQRRCWSSELHKAFVRALEELGGPHVATPKQIRDLMQVDGLTNDEVKSHLQKYRLHIRRSPKKQIDSSGSQSTAVLGNSWNNNDPSVEYFKDSESGSPPGPLDLLVHHENDGSYD